MKNMQNFMDMGYDYGNAAEAALAAQEAEESFESKFPQVVMWLNNYNGDFEFYVSVRNQYRNKGTLSDKQREAIERAIARDNVRTQAVANTVSQIAEVVEYNNPTFVAGTQLKISRSIAKQIAADQGYSYPFMNVEVVKTHRETSKAVFVTIKFSAQIGCSCGICGRPLDTEVSRATGIGPVCADKIGLSRYSVDEAKQVLVEISEKLNLMGEVKIWLPRSKISRR